MANLYEIRRFGKIAFLTAAAVVVAAFLYISNNLLKELAAQERQRMEIWADATKRIVSIGSADTTGEETSGELSGDIDFLLSIIERNTTIPVLLTDDGGNILQHRNFDLPEPESAGEFGELSPANEAFLKDKLEQLSTSNNVIHITISPGLDQHLYYEDSKLLRRLSYFPYIQLVVMLVFIAVVYFAVLSTKKAEQNKVWVGLSKETAHQLGTPISSLMAWMELLPGLGVDGEVIDEMNKDVQRLNTIASRFSKIGSVPKMEPADLNCIVGKAAEYMSTRISRRIALTASLGSGNGPDTPGELPVMACAPLFEWVMENLTKNAVDAMDGEGRIHIATFAERDKAVIEVSDTGKGIPRRNFDNVFNPGFTTKKRGWGLGLALARRIITEYHKGRIFVKASTPGKGTTFRIEIPLSRSGSETDTTTTTT